jgi:hypothetical protein
MGMGRTLLSASRVLGVSPTTMETVLSLASMRESVALIPSTEKSTVIKRSGKVIAEGAISVWTAMVVSQHSVCI